MHLEFINKEEFINKDDYTFFQKGKGMGIKLQEEKTS
jgi:hypothetical protein